jgi:biotin operon repressor
MARMVAATRAKSVNVALTLSACLFLTVASRPNRRKPSQAAHGAFMSEILNCDPSRGFVAFPMAVFDLELTPGAFRTLAELCRMANASGDCWPSLAQLGRSLGRSRAAVSGYITELRAVGVLKTQEQKMANGYNYRLRYTITFWKEWRAGLSKKATKNVPKPERSVRQAERPLETKNQIYKNQLGSGSNASLVSAWKHLVGAAPYPEFESWPSDVILAQTESMLRYLPKTTPLISADIDAAFAKFTEDLGLSDPDPVLGQGLIDKVTTHEALSQLLAALHKVWEPHWRKPPNLYQVERLQKLLPQASGDETAQKLLKSYLRRWKLYQQRLPSAAIRSTVSAIQYPRI